VRILTMLPDARPVSTTYRSDRRLDAVIAEYLQAGPSPDRRDFLERYPNLTGGLVSFFASEDRVKHLAGLAQQGGALDLPTGGLARRAGPEADHSAEREIGEFELLNEIACGGMGRVFKARHKRLNRIVALKMVRTDVLRPTDQTIRRLRFEAEVIASLDHPNIVPLYEVGEQWGRPYLVLKFIPGGDLERYIPRLRKKPRAVARLMARVARAVHYAHLRGVLHCDLKPSNILLDPHGEPHITDFGLAKCVEAGCGMTQSGLILGTPSYMSPEQVLGGRSKVTKSADIYGLGAVLYKLLTGRPPFQAETLYETLQRVREHQPTPLRAYNPKVDRELEAICLRCLEKEPGRRYESAAALARDLERWVAGKAIAPGRVGRREQFGRWCDRNRVVIAMSAALVGLVAIFALAGVATAAVICNYALAAENSLRASSPSKADDPGGGSVTAASTTVSSRE
jgi:eukaryotic-like serine/threonine-protein kinase